MESKIDKQKCNADADKKTSVESSPHIWGNLLRWCNSDATNQPLTGRANARPHECKTCGKRFTLLENLNRHQMIHTNQRPFHCPHCSKSFRLSQHLKEHIRIHTGEKPYKCHICGHAFCQISNLKSHQKTHTKVKGFRCDQCGKEFRRSFTLKQHKLTHTKSTRSKSEVQFKPADLSMNRKDNTAAINRNTENSEKIRENRKAEYSLNPATGIQNSFLKNTNEVNKSSGEEQKKTIESTHFMTFWNNFCQNSKSGTLEKCKQKEHEKKLESKINPCDLTSDKNTLMTYSQISKFFGLQNTPSLSCVLPKEEKSISLQNVPFLPFNAVPSTTSHLKTLSAGLPTVVTQCKENELKVTSTYPPISSPRSEKNFPIRSEQAEKVVFDISSRKRKHASSIHDSVMNSSTIFNDDLAKNNIFSKTRQAKSLTFSQEYNWKRQLCREWLDEEVGQRRSNSAETSRDNAGSRAGAAKCRVVSLSIDEAKSFSRNFSSAGDKLPKFTRSFSYFEDDVFSPAPTNSVMLTSSSDLKISSNSPLNGVASSIKKPFPETKETFYFPDVAREQKLRYLTEKKLDTKDQNPFHFNIPSLKHKQTLSKSDERLLEELNNKNSRKVSHLLSNELVNPLLKQNFYDYNKQHGKAVQKPVANGLESRLLSEIKNKNLPYAKPWFDVSPSYNELPVSPQLPVSPDFKSLTSHLSFVPLVSWRPVVTGWRSIVDGNVYPARLGVDNLNPFSMQQQIS